MQQRCVPVALGTTNCGWRSLTGAGQRLWRGRREPRGYLWNSRARQRPGRSVGPPAGAGVTRNAGPGATGFRAPGLGCRMEKNGLHIRCGFNGIIQRRELRARLAPIGGGKPGTACSAGGSVTHPRTPVSQVARTPPATWGSSTRRHLRRAPTGRARTVAGCKSAAHGCNSRSIACCRRRVLKAGPGRGLSPVQNAQPRDDREHCYLCCGGGCGRQGGREVALGGCGRHGGADGRVHGCQRPPPQARGEAGPAGPAGPVDAINTQRRSYAVPPTCLFWVLA